MKYTTQIDIDLPRAEVIEKMDNPENMKHWQKGLQSYALLQGSPGKEGAQMELNYKMGKRDMTLIETILTNNFPSEIHASYETKNVRNVQKNYFEEIAENRTRWISESEFKFDGIGMKILAFVLPGMFKKQSMTYMKDFKNFAEKGTSVSDSN